MATKKQIIERWQNALRVLRGLTPHERRKHWDMSSVAQVTPCGTVCCAVGWCGLDPWFMKRGLKTHVNDDYVTFRGDKGSVEDFFGDEGTKRIFWNPDQRSVGKVIREVQAHIKKLRSPDYYWDSK